MKFWPTLLPGCNVAVNVFDEQDKPVSKFMEGTIHWKTLNKQTDNDSVKVSQNKYSESHNRVNGVTDPSRGNGQDRPLHEGDI